MNSGFHIVIPARMASERLPGKPLLRIAGRTMIEHVYGKAKQSSALSVVVATDSHEIADAVQAFGGEAVMTSPAHTSGSDRLAECVNIKGWLNDAVVVNLQGDEPLMPPACLDQAAAILQQNEDADVASLYWPIELASDVEDPNVVKVVVGDSGQALYFSRSVIPYPRSTDITTAMKAGRVWNRHIGMYAYRAGALRAFSTMQPSPLERIERLEQLRFLEAGRSIVLQQACQSIPAGVDTPEDLARVRALMADDEF